MAERITTARGTFRVASQSREELEALGFGYYCDAGDGEHIIMGDGMKAVAVRIQPESTVEPETDTKTANTAESESDESVAGATYAGEPVTLEAIAHEFARQPKYYDERWTRSFRDSTDSVIKFHYTWDDSDGFEHRDWVSILLSDACREAGVEFDYIADEDDLEERVYVELVVQGYELDDNGDPADEDGERARDDIREQIWQAAIDEYNRARDELCSHEDISEPWFRELVEEMYARVKASVEEYEI